MLNDFIKRLLMMRQFSIENGKIELLKDSQLLVNSDLITQLGLIDPEKFYKLVKENVKEKTISYTKVMGSTPSMISVESLKSLFESLGIGSLQIQDINKTEKRALIKITNSAIALSHIEKKIKSKEPVCNYVSGVLAGAFSAIFEKDVNCKELNCMVLGSKQCEFVIR
jgi:predicted hydrocarbon binding protein